jgi:integrase
MTTPPDDRPASPVSLPVVALTYVPEDGMIWRAQRPLPQAPPDGLPPTERLRLMANDFFGSLTLATRKVYQRGLDMFAEFLACATVADALRTIAEGDAGNAFAVLTRWKTDLVARGYASGTINQRLMAVRAILTFAHDCGMIPWVVKVRRMKVQQKDMRGPGRDGVAKLLGACAGPTPMEVRDRLILRLLYNAALRQAEARSLDIEHVDLEHGRIFVLRKGREFRHWLSVSPKVVDAMRAWIALRGTDPGPLIYNFDASQKASRRLTGCGVWEIVKKLAAKAGLDPKTVRPHGLRHAGITTALDVMNGNITDVMKFSGHASPEMVLRYNDNRKDMAREVAMLMDSMDGVPDEEPMPPRHATQAEVAAAVDEWESQPCLSGYHPSPKTRVVS